MKYTLRNTKTIYEPDQGGNIYAVIGFGGRKVQFNVKDKDFDRFFKKVKTSEFKVGDWVIGIKDGVHSASWCLGKLYKITKITSDPGGMGGGKFFLSDEEIIRYLFGRHEAYLSNACFINTIDASAKYDQPQPGEVAIGSCGNFKYIGKYLAKRGDDRHIMADWWCVKDDGSFSDGVENGGAFEKVRRATPDEASAYTEKLRGLKFEEELKKFDEQMRKIFSKKG